MISYTAQKKKVLKIAMILKNIHENLSYPISYATNIFNQMKVYIINLAIKHFFIYRTMKAIKHDRL